MSAALRSVNLAFACILIRHTSARGVCQTEECGAFATRIISYMDKRPDKKPCDDFYAFACKGFIDSAAVIPDDKTCVLSFTQVDDVLTEQLKTVLEEKSQPTDPLPYRNVRHLYSLCLDEQGIDARGVESAVAKLKEAGGWPVLGDWDEQSWNWLDTEIKLRNQQIGGNNLLEVTVSKDPKVTNRRIIQIDQGNLGLAREFLVKGTEDPLVNAYYTRGVEIAVLYGADQNTAEDEYKQTLDFEIELAKLTVPKEERRDFERMYNIFTLEELKTEMSWVDWERLLKGIMPEDVPLKDDELFMVHEVNYLKQLGDFLVKYPKKVIANYMMWMSGKSMSPNLTTAMRESLQKFREVAIGTKQRLPRWKECVGAARRLNIALASLYVQRFFDQTSKTEALAMVGNIREEMKNTIQAASWMDEATRAKAMEKISNMREYIGYPDELIDVSKVEEHYKGMVLDGDDYLEVLLKYYQWTYRYNFKRLREPVNKHDWKDHSDVAVVNAFYNPMNNAMVFPAGILQPPFFSAHLPKYVNYANIGMVMGHEITHGFDDQGSQFASNGDLNAWRTDGCKKTFDEKKQCFIDQYATFVESSTKLHLNGVSTQGENIADNGGIKLAYRAYQKLGLDEPALPGLEDYSAEKMFMLSMANLWCGKYRPEMLKVLINTGVHAPGEFRVNGMLYNFPEFSTVFPCSNKDPMNPEHKCSVW